jgi:hypothetical protein
MDKRIAGLLGAAAAVTVATGAQAAPTQPAQLRAASSYKDLLEPIPNAVALLKADETARAQAAPAVKVERVQYHHHHHHHHHHNGFFPGAVIGGVIGGLLAAPRPAYAPPPPCYWTWGQPYWNGYRWVRPRVQVCQ